MEGKEPEDPTRFGVIKAKGGRAGVAKLPYGWFALTSTRISKFPLSCKRNSA
jgi:hypothetical protein